jgi:hypothetical protein
MSRCSEVALEEALRQLSEHAASSRARSNWMSTYLVAQRMHAAGYPFSTAGADEGVNDLFVLVPDHPRGRSNPFVDLRSDYRWGQVENSGRKTVWNTGTRNGAQTVLFNKNHFSHGLRPVAIDVMLQNLGSEEPLPGRDALAVLLTRDHNWPSEPSRQGLHDVARAILSLSQPDFERITKDTELGVPVLGMPEWSPELFAASELGPPWVTAPAVEAVAPAEDVSIESVRELPEQFRKFLGSYGIATGSHDELVDLLAATLSSQFVIMAGPSGSGKSLMASALAAFFASKDRRCRLEASRLLAKPEEFLGYYSHLADQKFMAYDQLLSLLDLDIVVDGTPPMITIEEANLSPIEGYLAALIHGLGGLETKVLPIRLHTQPGDVESQVPQQKVPPVLKLAPYPRFFATINVDADSPAPARKVVSRACVELLETPTFETALAAVDTLVHPSVEDATGPAAAFIGRPTIAFDRYVETGSEVYQQALGERATLLRDELGVEVIAHRQLQRSLVYMAWFVELEDEGEPEAGHQAVEAAADNAILHFVLPSLPAAQFGRGLRALDNGSRQGVLGTRLMRLRSVLDEQQFGPLADFWGALS